MSGKCAALLSVSKKRSLICAGEAGAEVRGGAGRAEGVQRAAAAEDGGGGDDEVGDLRQHPAGDDQVGALRLKAAAAEERSTYRVFIYIQRVFV